MDTPTVKTFDELTEYEKSLVQSGTGWDGDAYHDKDGLTIKLVDGGYIVEKPEGVVQTETTDEATTETTTDTTEVETGEVAPEVATDSTNQQTDETVEEYNGPMGKYRITGLAETTDEDGNVTGTLEVGQVYELPEPVGNDLVTKEVAELVTE